MMLQEETEQLQDLGNTEPTFVTCTVTDRILLVTLGAVQSNLNLANVGQLTN